MDWAAGNRWRKAMVLSLLLHSMVLIGVGWLAGKALVPAEIPEMLIELELVSESDGSALAATPDMPPSNAQPVTIPQPVPMQPPVSAEPVIQEPVVAVSAMAVVAVDNSAIVTASAPAASDGGGGTPAGGGGASGGGSGTGAGTGIGSGAGKSGDIIPPGILSRKEPSYPEQARQAGLEGTVVLKIQILETGRPGQISVYQSSGFVLLDDAAATAVQRWRFVPARIRGNGQSIACYTTMPVVFKLRA